jgi:limonene-1,2-epoxide hydrolase
MVASLDVRTYVRTIAHVTSRESRREAVPMSSATPEEVVRDFCSNFGPTYEDMVATSRRLVREDVNWVAPTFEKPITSIDQFLADLERARALGVHGFEFEIHHLAVDGDVVLMQRTDKTLDKDGKVLYELDMMCMHCVQDGKFRWVKEYFFDPNSYVEAWGDVNT